MVTENAVNFSEGSHKKMEPLSELLLEEGGEGDTSASSFHSVSHCLKPDLKATVMIAWATWPSGNGMRINMLPTIMKKLKLSSNYIVSSYVVSLSYNEFKNV